MRTQASLALGQGQCQLEHRMGIGSGFALAQQGVDLVGLKRELGHGRLPGAYAFGQRLGPILEGIALRQDAEGRSEFKWACASGTRGMTACAVLFGDGTSAPSVL